MGSKILVILTVLTAAIMLAFTGYYFYKWSFMDDARVMLVVQLVVDALWLIPISVFYKQMDIQKYKDDTYSLFLNAILKKWLNNGCVESPEEIEEILKSEYMHRKQD